MSVTTPVDNRTLVEEEKSGFASLYLVQHRTQIVDPDVRARIATMSIAEVVS